MTDLPNPFESSCGALSVKPCERQELSADRLSPQETSAATSDRPQGPDVAADIQELLDAIGCRFVLDEEAFMAAIEPPPLFLQRTA